MKKTAFAEIPMLTFMLLVVGANLVNLAEANPFIGRTRVAPPPGTLPAEITFLQPKNFTTYPSGDLNVTFQVAKPETSVSARFGALTVQWFLNGWSRDMKVFYYPSSEVEITTVLPNMYGGSNELVIQASCTMENLITGDLFFIEGNSTVYFTIEDVSSSHSPSPSPSHTPEPTATSYGKFQSTEQELILGVAVTIAVFCAGLGLLVYLIKRK